MNKIYLPSKLNLLVILFLFTVYDSSGQTDSIKINVSSSKVIFEKIFDNLIDSCINLLQPKELNQISDNGHIYIMMCFNTTIIPKYKNDRYKRLTDLLEEKDYWRKIVTIYPDWIPSRGMGYYFLKLKMEFGGTPRPYAYFKITKNDGK